jgi:hypothetical protein
MSPRSRGYPWLRWLGFGILAVTWGPFLIDFAVLITWGAILMPVVGLAILTPFVLANYGIWGCWTTRNTWTRDQSEHTF